MSNNWHDDSFEILERGQYRQKAPQTKPKPTSVFDIQKKLRELSGDVAKSTTATRLEKVGGGANFTPIDVAALGEKYKKQDDPELKKIREKLHYLKRQQEDTLKAIETRKRREEERKRKQEEEIEKKKQEKPVLPPVEAPKGKERKSIFFFRKKKRAQSEIRPEANKQ